MTVLSFIGGQKYAPAPYRWKSDLGYLILGGISIFVGSLTWISIPLVTANLGLIIVIVFIGLYEFRWQSGKPHLKV
jgi:asparagine N-glycosylation enzyme membrane subunit Stt3